MATATYEPIATYTSTGSVSTYTFSSIPSTYTDIVAVANFQLSTATGFRGRVNGDTGSNYSLTNLGGNGIAASSSRESNVTNWVLGGVPTSASTDYDNNIIIHYMNYANTTTYKTVINRFGSASKETMANANLWRSTAAINSITLYVASGNFVNGSTFTLYGIKAA
jgi:hypothetical protein